MFGQFVATISLRKMNGDGGVRSVVTICDWGNEVQPSRIAFPH
jgi:hypothetical protein